MKHWPIYILMLTALAWVFVACGTDEDLPATQRTGIAKYLAAQGYKYQTITDSGDTVYVYRPKTEVENPSTVVAEQGSSVSFWFAAYTFNSQPSSTPYFTNRQALIPSSTVLNTKYWSFEPYKVKLGSDKIIKGLQMALPNCKAGEELLVFMASNLAYGDGAFSILEPNQAVMFNLIIVDVNK